MPPSSSDRRVSSRPDRATPAWALTKIKDAKDKQLKALDLHVGFRDRRTPKLSHIPPEVFELTQLITLKISGNHIRQIPAAIAQLHHLTILDLSDNQIEKFPAAIAHLANLTELDLRTNQIVSIPKAIAQLEKLTKLCLSYNRIKVIPETIAHLHNLTKLSLASNQIRVIPEQIGKLSTLTFLDLSSNEISLIPDTIAQLENLSQLSISFNQIREIPDALGNLPKLARLALSFNLITQIPESLARLSNLSRLSLYSNQIREIPAAIAGLEQLQELDVYDNPIVKPPVEVGYRGIDGIRSYYRQLQEVENDYLYEAKLIVIGEPGAGKTSLTKKIQNPDYQLTPTEAATEGIDVLQYQFPLDNGRPFRVNIWDFGGQEIYHATHQFFLTKRSLYFLVADTRKEDTDFYYWLNVVELLSDHSPLLIINNEKQDRKRQINERSLRGRFDSLKATLATNLATNRGLDQVLENLQHYIKQLPHVGCLLPRTWIKVRETLEQDPRNYITLEEFLQICEQHGFLHRRDKLQLSSYLHDLGICLHFQSDPLLNKIVILKPSWGTAAAYRVLDNPTIRDQHHGRFTWEDLTEIWSDDTYANMQGELLRLMCNFQLCYEIPDQPNTYIVPQLLSGNQPDYEWDETQNLILRYTYPEFMPKGILTRLMVAMHDSIEQQDYVWRSGVILKKEHTRAEVIECYSHREIKIRVSGSQKRDLMTIVTHELDQIHRSYVNLKHQKLIPCNCNVCKGSQTPHFYRLESLERRREGRYFEVECDISYEKVDVRSLLDDVTQLIQWPLQTENCVEGDPVVCPLNQLLEKHEVSRQAEHSHPILEKEVFLSYAWGGESEEMTDQIDQTFQEKGITIIRDRRAAGYKADIKEFMQRLGRGKAIVVVMSDKYLKSPNCMFELLEILSHGKLYDRIFPVVLRDAQIYDPLERIQYVKYWEEKIRELEEALRTVGSGNMQGFRDDIDLYINIRAKVAELTDTLKDMNTLTAEIHLAAGFDQLFHGVKEMLE